MINKINTENRLNYLKDCFNIFDSSNPEFNIKQIKKNGFNDVVSVTNSNDNFLALIGIKKNNNKVFISDFVFEQMISSDPSSNNMYTQWMLNTFSKLLKKNDLDNIKSAIRFVEEDLPLAKTYLKIFDDNKRKTKFINLCKNSFILKGILDPRDINQYKSLGQLYDAVDPFIDKDSSEMSELLHKYVESGQAEIPVRDRKFTLFIPKNRDASVLFDKFANWCTAKPDNGMFRNYTNHKTPSSKKSQLFIIIKNEFFDGIINDDTLIQIHFETNQIKDRKNISNVNIFDKIISQSYGLSNYFYELLINYAKKINKIDDNPYLDYLIEFGFSECLFDFFDSNINVIKLENKNINKLPDLSRFKNLEILEIIDCNLSELNNTIGSLDNLKLLILSNNKIKELPSEIGYLKNLRCLILVNNNISEIPENIKYLDKSNGGSLHRFIINKRDINDINYKKLIDFLPTTII